MDLETAAALVLGAAAPLAFWWWQPPAIPVVNAVTQLTTDGAVKANGGRMATDGSRIYFGEGTLGSYRIMQVAAAGGPAAVISVPVVSRSLEPSRHIDTDLPGVPSQLPAAYRRRWVGLLRGQKA